jgi:hypothetical protein
VTGFVSDRTGKRKTRTILGYAFSTLAKTIIALQTTLLAAAWLRVIERLGKAFRGAVEDRPELRLRFRRNHLGGSLRVLHFVRNKSFSQNIAAFETRLLDPGFGITFQTVLIAS